MNISNDMRFRAQPDRGIAHGRSQAEEIEPVQGKSLRLGDVIGTALFDRAVKTRFICTIGPKTVDQESLARLHSAGMNIARVNGAHGSLDATRSSTAPRSSCSPRRPRSGTIRSTVSPR
jgi:hypothetical protein